MSGARRYLTKELAEPVRAADRGSSTLLARISKPRGWTASRSAPPESRCARRSGGHRVSCGRVKLKALLLCEDVRFELAGTVTLVGVFNERVFAPPGEGPIQFARLAFVAVIGGLRGVEEISFRQWIRLAEDEGELPPMTIQRHDPEADEHSFVFSQSPMVFPEQGTYEVAIDLAVGARTVGYRYPFAVHRRSA